jgi:hypothetical protein
VFPTKSLNQVRAQETSSDGLKQLDLSKTIQVIVNTAAVALVLSAFLLVAVSFKAIVEETGNAKYAEIQKESAKIALEMKNDIKTLSLETRNDIKSLKNDIDGLKISQGIITTIGVASVGIIGPTLGEIVKNKVIGNGQGAEARKEDE